jgi:hypothetical protein
MKSAIHSGPRKVTMAGIEWTEQYGCYRAVLDNWLELKIVHEKGTFRIEVAGRRLVRSAATVEEAVIIVTATARVWLQRALAELEGGE